MDYYNFANTTRRFPCHLLYSDGESTTIQLKCRIDTAIEIEYVEHGGVLHYVSRNLAKAS